MDLSFITYFVKELHFVFAQLTGGDHADEVTDIPDVRFSDVKVSVSCPSAGLPVLHASLLLLSRVSMRPKRSLKTSLNFLGILRSSNALVPRYHEGFCLQVCRTTAWNTVNYDNNTPVLIIRACRPPRHRQDAACASCCW